MQVPLPQGISPVFLILEVVTFQFSVPKECGSSTVGSVPKSPIFGSGRNFDTALKYECGCPSHCGNLQCCALREFNHQRRNYSLVRGWAMFLFCSQMHSSLQRFTPRSALWWTDGNGAIFLSVCPPPTLSFCNASRGGMGCSPIPWIWAAFVTCFGPQNVAEVTVSQYKPRPQEAWQVSACSQAQHHHESMPSWAAGSMGDRWRAHSLAQPTSWVIVNG